MPSLSSTAVSQAEGVTQDLLPSPDGAVEASLWRRFKLEGDMAARDLLIRSHLDFARIMAGKTYAQRYESTIAFNEYMQLASMGLIEAVDRYEPHEGGATFRTYAAHCIRGTILNGMRHLSEVHAQIEARKRVHRDRLHSLARRTRNDAGASHPEEDEEAAAQEEPVDAFDRMASMAMGVALGFMLDDLRIYQSTEGVVEDCGMQDLHMRRMRSTLAQAVRSLPTRERTLITRHYFEGMAFEEMARTWEISRGRVSQLHKQALMDLRLALSQAGLGDWSV